MIEPYNLNTNNNLNQMLGNMMENTFFFLIILLTVWIFVSLIMWLIRKPYKIRKSNQVWNEEFNNKCFNTNFYISNTNYYYTFKMN